MLKTVLVTAVFIVLLQGCGGASTNATLGSSSVIASAAAAAPTLDVPQETLDAALSCSADYATAGREVVLLIPGTALNVQADYAWNWVPALQAKAIPYCTLELPGDSMGDIQISAEYIVNAIRSIAHASGRKVQIVGHSQGGMSPRWALKYWPDTRDLVDDLIGLAPSNHGTVDANVICAAPCAASFWQQAQHSKFLTALNSDTETWPEVSYTAVYTKLVDEVVVPNLTATASSSSLQGGGTNVANIAVQDVCPLHVTDHLLIGTADPVSYAIAMDALTHDGPADPARVLADNPGLCTQAFMPGVDPLTFATNFANLTAVIGENVALAPRVAQEPALASYVGGN